MKSFAVFCLGVLTSYSAIAAGCDWATETPPDDAKYKYFVAKSYSDTSAADAANKAERDIDAQLGRMFGVSLDVQSAFYADESTSAGTTRSYERSIGTIALKGLERQRSNAAKESGGWVGCVQYRYSQKEYQREKERLAKLPATTTHSISPFTEVAGDTTCKGAPVEIRTVPENAFVTLDNGKYQGMTPIKFGNVCNGKHSIEITKDNYKPVQEQLIVPATGTINKTLKRDSKQITVRTSLGKSKITINGVDRGKEPVKFNAPLGIEQTITATNAEAVKISRSRTFSKDSDSEYIIGMEKLPGRLDFSAFKVRNPDVRITVDGKEIKGNTTGELSPDKSHKLNFSKKGFYEINKSLSISGGDTTYYPSNELRFSKEPIATTGGLVGLGLSAGSDTFGLNVDFGADYKTKYFYTGIGAQINYMWLSDAKMTFDYNFRNYSVPHTADIGLSYWEILYFNLGFNIGRRLSLFGIGTAGALSISAENSTTTASLNVGAKLKPMFRYGVGIQYSAPSDKDKEWGVRFSYLTGKTHLSPSDIGFSHINNYDTSDINISNGAFDSYPEQINSFNITFFVRGFSATGGKHADN